MAACAGGAWMPGTPGWSGTLRQDQTPPPRLMNAEQKADLAYHVSNLTGPVTTPENRVRAAQYLIRMQVPQAAAALDAALRSGNHEQISAVVAAAEVEPNVPLSLAEALIQVVRRHQDDDRSRERLQAIGRIFSDWGAAGASLAASVAPDAERPQDERVAATRILGEMRGWATARTSVEALITLIDPERKEAPAITDAAFDALARVTGLDQYGRDTVQWLGWWETTRDTPAEEWLPNQMDRLNQRVTSLAQELVDERSRAALYQARLEAAMNRLYFELAKGPESEMSAQLAEWIRDEFAPVRRNGIQRAALRVANGQPLSPVVHEALAERISRDPDPELRRSAARTLDRQNFAGLGEIVAQALRDESDPESTAVYLDILSRRPVASAASDLIDLVADDRHRPAAAAACNAMIRAGHLDDAGGRARLLKSLRTLDPGHQMPEIIRLIGAIGEETDLRGLVPLLDSSDEVIRRAAAEALRPHALARDEILSRADDPVVYVTALAVVADDDEPSRETINHLVRMTPPNAEVRTEWWTAITRLGARIGPGLLEHFDARVMEIPDQALAPRERAEVRAAVLTRVATMAPDALSPEVRRRLLTTLADQALLIGDPNLALSALDRIASGGNGGGEHGNGNGNATNAGGNGGLDARQKRLRLTALLFLSDWERALGVDPAPAAWIAAAELIARADPDRAAIVAGQIGERFTDLDQTQRDQVERLAAGGVDLESPTPDPAAPEESGG